MPLSTCMDCVINETLRLNAPLAQVNCECVEDYKFNDIYTPAGLQVIIPTVYFLHRDHDAWPDPEKFDPERFRSDAKDTRHPCQFLAFGFRPRSCIGMGFVMEIKIALVKFLMKNKLLRSPETQVPLEILAGVTLIPKYGVHARENRKG